MKTTHLPEQVNAKLLDAFKELTYGRDLGVEADRLIEHAFFKGAGIGWDARMGSETEVVNGLAD